MTLGVAVIGLGVGEAHARTIHRDDRCEIRWLIDNDKARAAAVRSDLGSGDVGTDFRTVTDDPNVDLVAIASYDTDHYEQAKACLEAGKHVFVEKPLCRTRDELVDLHRTWTESPASLMSNLVLRTAPAYRHLKNRIEQGELGRIYSFDGDYLYGRLDKITDGWRRDIDGYSVMLGGGIHIIDLLLWLTGSRPARVDASGNDLCTHGTSFEPDDFVAAAFEFESGTVATIKANFGCVHPHQHVVRVFGTEGTFLCDDAGVRYWFSREEGQPPERPSASALPASKGALLEEYIDSVVDDEAIDETTRSFFDGVSACLSADAALGSGERVEIEYVTSREG